MGDEIIAGVYFEPLPVIKTTGGSVMHAIKGFDKNFPEFGECYFSTAENKSPKAWKKHTKMTCNLFIPAGKIMFVFYDERKDSETFGQVKEFVFSTENYGRLIITPGIWFGFCSIFDGGDSILLNVCNIKHDPAESMRLEPGAIEIPYKWNVS